MDSKNTKLSRDPEKQTARAYKARIRPPKIKIERALTSEEVAAIPQPEQPRPRRAQWLWLGLCLFVLVVIGGSLFFVSEKPAEPEVTVPPPEKTVPEITSKPEIISMTASQGSEAATKGRQGAAPGLLRYGALQITVTVPEQAKEYLAGKAIKKIWAQPVFSKAVDKQEEAWKTAADLPCILDGLPAGSAEIALQISGFEVKPEMRRVLVPVNNTADVEFAASPYPAVLTVDCDVKQANVSLQLSASSEELPLNLTKAQQLTAEVPALSPLSLFIESVGYQPYRLELTDLEPGEHRVQEVFLEPLPPPVSQKKAPVKYRPKKPLILTLGHKVDLKLIWIPPGEFVMGSPDNEYGRFSDEGPQHAVELTEGFWMGCYQVTQAQWQEVMGENPSQHKGAGYPVEQVSWEDCLVFLEKLNVIAGKLNKIDLEFRLPTEAEWEYACRAGTGTTLPNNAKLTSLMGNCRQLNPIAWYADNSQGKTHPVGRKKANNWGLYDMLGNVWEWCSDGKRTYNPIPQVDPKAKFDESQTRVSRGGSMADYPQFCRSATRYTFRSIEKNPYLGLRLAARESLPEPEEPQTTAEETE